MSRGACVWIGILLGSIVLLVIGASGASANSPSPADEGNAIFQAHCSTCHGDRGQGLAEWRLTFDPLHQNCSRPNCHGLRHPPDGFYLPNNYAPRIIGDNTLTRFQTAQDLYNFISKNMPFQEPGSLAAGDYWLLVAFLLQQHNITVDQVGPQNAQVILLQPAAETSIGNILPVVIGVALAWIIAGGFVVWSRRRRKDGPGN
jgi:Cytochrome C oxidase, cbb3-type, subunit III